MVDRDAFRGWCERKSGRPPADASRCVFANGEVTVGTDSVTVRKNSGEVVVEGDEAQIRAGGLIAESDGDRFKVKGDPRDREFEINWR